MVMVPLDTGWIVQVDGRPVKTEWCGASTYLTSKTPDVAIDERGLVRSMHLFLFSCVH